MRARRNTGCEPAAGVLGHGGKQGELHMGRGEVLRIGPGQDAPEVGVIAGLWRVPGERPRPVVAPNLDPAAIGQGRFKALDAQKGHAHRPAGLRVKRAVSHVEPPTAEVVAQDRHHIGAAHRLVIGGAVSDAKKPDPRAGIADAFGDQLHLGAVIGASHPQQFEPIVDRPDRRYQVVADAAADQSCNIDVAMTHGAPHSKGM
mmetsp:Transcript_27655/g.51360  ORF Transcript_27655/g.51360 Transcript_27655/m.51360 type:complete len:202 (-) Transcript_27655:1518-2123(-)